MTWLVLDTSMPLATIAVVEGTSVLGAHVLSETRRHAESLVDALDRALLLAGRSVDELRGIAVGRGPGSFIGVRTGIAFAKGLGLARGIPVVGLPTLTALALTDALPDGAGLVAIDAKRGEVYAQRFTQRVGSLEPNDEPTAISVDVAVERARGGAFLVGNAPLGDVALASGGRRVALEGPGAVGLARALTRLLPTPVDEIDTLVPDYRRDADAKLPASDPAARRALFGPRFGD